MDALILDRLSRFVEGYRGGWVRDLALLERDSRSSLILYLLGRDPGIPEGKIKKIVDEWVTTTDSRYELIALLAAMNAVSEEQGFNEGGRA